MFKRKNQYGSITPYGEQLDGLEAFYNNPLIAWWNKAALWLLGDKLHQISGSLRWCNRCGRKHSAHAGCSLVAVERKAKSGREVIRLLPSELA